MYTFAVQVVHSGDTSHRISPVLRAVELAGLICLRRITALRLRGMGA